MGPRMIIAALLLSLSDPNAGQWLKLFDEADESTYLERSAGPRSADPMVWIRHDYPRVRPDGVKSARDQWLVSCRDRSFTIYAMVTYDRAGRVIQATAVPEDQRMAATLGAGSRMERVFSAVCAPGR